MKTAGRITQACVSLVLFFSALSLAQQQTPPIADGPPKTIEREPVLLTHLPPPLPPSSEGRIHLDVMVKDASGKPVAGLTQSDLSLLDDGHAQKILSFHSANSTTTKADPPVEVILVIDTINNGFVELAHIREGIEKFLLQNGGRLANPVSIALLTAHGLQMQGKPSVDGNALADVVRHIQSNTRPVGIATFPVSILSLLHLASDEAQKPGMKMVVWLGAGWPVPPPVHDTFTAVDERNQRSHFNLIVQLSTSLREARINLYGGYANADYYVKEFVTGVRKVSEVDGRTMSLGVLALQSGGRGEVPYINLDSDVRDQINHYVAEADTFYTLSFNPPHTENRDEYHELRVVVNKPGMTARTRDGYYNQPQSIQPKSTPNLASEQTPNEVSFVATRISVNELMRLLKKDANKSDEDLAQDLAGLELTERLSAADLLYAKSRLRGAKASDALVALADASVFLDPPADHMPPNPVPDIAEQRRIVALAVDYLVKVLPKLPNFFATRVTSRYEDPLPGADRAGRVGTTAIPHVVGTSKAVVLYRDGKEVVDAAPAKERKASLQGNGLETKGTFGPILTTVIVDAAHSEMKFSHWETDDTPIAVFRYAVPKEKAHYQVSFQSIQAATKSLDMQQQSGYHGEVAIDAATGTILRITVQADLDPGMPIARADIMVEYGAVEIGAKKYFCPVRSVALSRGPTILSVKDKFGGTLSYGPEMTRLNDVAFGEYHVFRTESRILPAYDDGAENK